MLKEELLFYEFNPTGWWVDAYLNFRQGATARVKLRCKEYLFVGLINIK